MRLPLPPRVDLRVARVARKLSVLELMSDDDTELDHDDVLLGDGSPRDRSARAQEAFLNFYSHDGIRRAMAAYGFDERLQALGLADNELVLSREDAFHHRMELFIDGGRGDERRIMDLHVHLQHVAEPGADEESKGRRTYAVMMIEWLNMQNPKASFTPQRPRLPGQRFPGTGLGRLVHNVLMVSAERTRRDALIAVPEHFHLARLYLAGGYRYAKIAAEQELEAVADAAASAGLSFAAAAWAVERGFVLERTADGTRPWRYQPEELILPLTSRLRSRMPGLRDWVAEQLFAPTEHEISIDVDGLRRSLADDPVDQLSPDSL